ncbi:hypothetical protein [Streptomyces sp. ITFR-16]|uniref:hypothetical protein n=1 Tax=Streptomyces sp. ITFR-16 TaxID=3075198 RepID=UPI00288B501A|nr:hypothetical protein [Streptomyces sp. ITFR-16]WNI27198.1 hypothetical protein RLT58_35245 [Streptomyces sp. ITFR-16]
MHRFTRHTGRVLAAVALLAGLTTACSGPSATPKAPQPRQTAAATATPAPQPTPRPDRERLDKMARDVLNGTGEPDWDDKDLVSSGSLAIPGMNVDETVKSGTALRIEVACAGDGKVTFTAVSGSARTTERVDCAQSMRNSFDFTTAAPSLAIQADSPDPEGVGTAYVVRRPA